MRMNDVAEIPKIARDQVTNGIKFRFERRGKNPVL